MTYTENYALNQWAKTDRLMMSDFNADNQKLDAALKANANAIAAETAARAAAVAACGNCRIVTGTYTGTGKSGSSNKNTLTFSGQPLLVLVSGDAQFFAVRGTASTGAREVGGTIVGSPYLTWGANSLSWYYDNGVKYQCNTNGVTYYYVALLLCE